jgi:hypothetical protein
METREDDREASVVQVDHAGAALAVSLDNGQTWTDLDLKSGIATVDLTSLVSGTYGYLLKITFNGQPETAVLRGLGITTWVQVAPAALPSLRAGRNRMEYRTGDHYGRKTRVKEVASNASDPNELAKYVTAMPANYDPSNKTQRIRGPVTVRVEALPHTKIAWFLASGSFRTHLHERASKTRNTMEYAVDQPENFREFYRARVPTDTEHWHYNAAREIQLDRPAERVFIRYTGDPAVNNFRVYAHCLDDAPSPEGPVRITHRWHEPDGRKDRTVELSGSGSYEIMAGENPVDESIEIAVPSGRR